MYSNIIKIINNAEYFCLQFLCCSPVFQAANMWKMLDDLAVTDKAAYEEMRRAGEEQMVSFLPGARVSVPV